MFRLWRFHTEEMDTEEIVAAAPGFSRIQDSPRCRLQGSERSNSLLEPRPVVRQPNEANTPTALASSAVLHRFKAMYE